MLEETMSSTDNLETALRDAENLCKKQRTCAAKTSQSLDMLLQSVRSAETQLRNGADGSALIQQLCLSLQNPDIAKDITNSVKDLHSAVTRLGKVHSSYSADVSLQ